MMINIETRYDGPPIKLPWLYLFHTLVAGITGSGKSSWTAAMIGEIAAHPNTAICGIDLKRVDLSGWRPRFTTLATNPDQATQLQQLVDPIPTYREKSHLRATTDVATTRVAGPPKKHCQGQKAHQITWTTGT